MFLDLKIENVSEQLTEYSRSDVTAYKENKASMFTELERYLLDEDSILDADKIQRDVFPLMDADIFISHSHRDQDTAIKIAISLEKIGLTAFVDSCVWGHADELLRKVDDKFCMPEGWSSYNYFLRNRTTANIHMILNSALHKMIDKSELFIFLDSKNSVRFGEYVNNTEHLSSPWIYSELMFASHVRRSPRKIISNANECLVFDHVVAKSQRDVEFVFPVPELTKTLDFNLFLGWLNSELNETYPYENLNGLLHLDELYRQLSVDTDLLTPRFQVN